MGEASDGLERRLPAGEAGAAAELFQQDKMAKANAQALSVRASLSHKHGREFPKLD